MLVQENFIHVHREICECLSVCVYLKMQKNILSNLRINLSYLIVQINHKIIKIFLLSHNKKHKIKKLI
jgi:hypothetical protein